MHNIHKDNQTKLMSSVYHWLQIIRGATTATWSKKVGHMVPDAHKLHNLRFTKSNMLASIHRVTYDLWLVSIIY